MVLFDKEITIFVFYEFVFIPYNLGNAAAFISVWMEVLPFTVNDVAF